MFVDKITTMKKILFILLASSALASCHHKKSEDPTPAVIHDTVFAYSLNNGVSGNIQPYIQMSDGTGTIFTFWEAAFSYTASSSTINREVRMNCNDSYAITGHGFPSPGTYTVETGSYYTSSSSFKGRTFTTMTVSYSTVNGKVYISVNPVINLDN